MSYSQLFKGIQNELSKMHLAVAHNDKLLAALASEKQASGAFEGIIGGIAMNLQSFYTAAERILEAIATDIDDYVPKGSQWHRELLTQMSIDLDKKRPAVLSADTFADLEELLRFRHFVRNAYSYTLDADRVLNNASLLAQCFVTLKRDCSQLQDSLSK